MRSGPDNIKGFGYKPSGIFWKNTYSHHLQVLQNTEQADPSVSQSVPRIQDRS